MTQFNVGFIGLSKSGWAATALAPPLLQNSDKYTLKAISTSTKDSAEATAAKYSELTGQQVKAYYGSTEQISNDPDVNFVAVSVKAPLHKETLTPVLEAGKDFFIEWPAGKNTSETIQFAEVAKAKGLKSLVGLQGWHAPVIRKVCSCRAFFSRHHVTHQMMLIGILITD
jgi:predicted dehydrogenase